MLDKSDNDNDLSLNSALAAEKKRQRAVAKQKLKELFKDKDLIKERTLSINDKIKELKEFQEAKTILIYHPLPDEINLEILIHSFPEKNWVLPRALGKGRMLFFKIDNFNNLVNGKYNLMEPVSTSPLVSRECLDLIIMPALAFNKEGHRLGRGGGYYDRLIADLDCQTIGVCFEELVFDNLALEAHDLSVDILVKA